MFSVYALYSKSIDRLYIGQTSDLERRLFEHSNGLSRFTKRASDWKLIHNETFESRLEAMKREKQLKSGGGRKFLRSLL